MKISRTVTATAAAVALITVVCGGCSSSTKTTTTATTSPAASPTATSTAGATGSPTATSTSTESPSPTAGATGAAVVGAATVGKFQNVLVDSQGRTLYLFEADTSPTSTCYDACATAWPPLLTTGTPTATGGADQAKITTTARKDGTSQVVYNGHPLYYFEGDTAKGDANGQESSAFGAKWYVVNVSGNKVEGD
ncbi:hypothetical protein [Kitasatospora sp. NPDC096140]|uniref:COG4315 family predicted lipoprotein n=1 Tax=unclassified Kitasatospora TaxID=2633591 RepID=UPI00331D448A